MKDGAVPSGHVIVAVPSSLSTTLHAPDSSLAGAHATTLAHKAMIRSFGPRDLPLADVGNPELAEWMEARTGSPRLHDAHRNL